MSELKSTDIRKAVEKLKRQGTMAYYQELIEHDPSMIDETEHESIFSAYYDEALLANLQENVNSMMSARHDTEILNGSYGRTVTWSTYGSSTPTSWNVKESGCSTSSPPKDS